MLFQDLTLCSLISETIHIKLTLHLLAKSLFYSRFSSSILHSRKFSFPLWITLRIDEDSVHWKALVSQDLHTGNVIFLPVLPHRVKIIVNKRTVLIWIFSFGDFYKSQWKEGRKKEGKRRKNRRNLALQLL